MRVQNKQILLAAATTLSLSVGCEKTKTKEVVRPETPWYQQTNSFQKQVYGEAVKLTRGTKCLRTDALSLASSNLLGIYSGAHSNKVIDRTFEFDDAGEHIIPSKSFQQEIFSEEFDDLFVCNLLPGSSTLEGVASYAAADIKVASDWYKSITGESLSAVQLHIHPSETLTIYERLSDTAKTKLLALNPKADVKPIKIQADAVNNAYWTLVPNEETEDDAEDTLPVIAVFPHSSKNTDGSADHPSPLWELPFVLRHEYGHHVFYHSLTPLLGSAQVHLKETLAANPTHHSTRAISVPSVFAREKGKSPLIDTSFLFGALNEGFADMYAFYASGLKMPGIEMAPCFVNTRDVASPSLGGVNVKKVFTADMIDILFNPKSLVKSFDPSKDAGCNAFNVLEIHDLGAVIAHTVDKVFDASPAVQAETDKARAKTKLALAWLDKLSNDLNLAESGPAVILAQILESAALTAAGPTPLTADAPVCVSVKTYFPGLKSRWIGSPLAVCWSSL